MSTRYSRTSLILYQLTSGEGVGTGGGGEDVVCGRPAARHRQAISASRAAGAEVEQGGEAQKAEKAHAIGDGRNKHRG
jgi:hypothetical protein